MVHLPRPPRPQRRRRFGNVEQLPSGKWRARYTGPDSRTYKAPTTFYDEADAVAWLRSEQKLIEFDSWSPPETRNRQRAHDDAYRTVGDWLEHWLDLRSRGADALKPSTLSSYRNVLNRRILEVTRPAAQLRAIPLTELTRRDVAVWFDDITRAFDSPTYNRSAYVRLRTAVQAAVDRDILPANPVNVPTAARHVKPERKELPEVDVMQAIVDELDSSKPRIDGRHKLIAILTLFHGLRIGEALGLHRADFTDTGDDIFVRIRGTAYREPGKGMLYMDTPKTDAAVRTVPIFERFHDDVRNHLARFVGNGPDAIVFTGPTGKRIMDTSFRSIMKRAKTRAGYEDVKITPHYGRVWLITTLAEADMPIPAIGEILGQRDLRTITEIYMRASETKKQTVLDSINTQLNGLPDDVADLAAHRAGKKIGKQASGDEAR